MAMSESEFYRLADLAQAEELRRERFESACDKILDAFDGRDVMTAFDVVSDGDPAKMHKLYDALAKLAQMETWKIEDEKLRDVAIAFQGVAHWYAGYRAEKEGGK